MAKAEQKLTSGAAASQAPRAVPEAMYKAALSRTFSGYEEPGAGRMERLVVSYGSDRFMTPAL